VNENEMTMRSMKAMVMVMVMEIGMLTVRLVATAAEIAMAM